MLLDNHGRENLAAAGPAGSVREKAGEHSGGSDDRLNGGNPYGSMLFTEANPRIVSTDRARWYSMVVSINPTGSAHRR